MSAPDDRHKQLNILAGTWDTTMTMLNKDGSDGAVSAATDRYDWMAGGFFLKHDVDAEMAGERFQSMEIIAVARDGDGYETRSYDPDGTINDFSARLDGSQWRIAGEVQRFAGLFTEDGKQLAGQWEQKGADGWQPLMKVVLRKRG